VSGGDEPAHGRHVGQQRTLNHAKLRLRELGRHDTEPEKFQKSPTIHEGTVPYMEIICGHCGRPCDDCLSTVNDVSVCHPKEPGRPDCYRLVTLYRHELNDCKWCKIALGTSIDMKETP
jgi:hypothetical protein